MRLINAKITCGLASLFAGLFFSSQVMATEALSHPADILYILSEDSKFYQTFTDNLQSFTNTSNANSQHRTSIRLISTDSNISGELNNQPKLVVSVGSKALQVISENNYEGPVFSVLTPALAFHQYKRTENYSALFADHPASLYLKLVKIAIPKSNRIGVLLGPSSSVYKDELNDTAKALGLRLYLKETDNSRHVARRISQLASQVDVILAIPDPVVHNARTAQSILYAAYRHNIPVVAYSSSYLKAGAMISLYSSPEQLAENASRHIINILQNNTSQRNFSLHPATFSIGINRTVSRSLGRAELDEVQLKNRLTSDMKNNNE